MLKTSCGLKRLVTSSENTPMLIFLLLEFSLNGLRTVNSRESYTSREK